MSSPRAASLSGLAVALALAGGLLAYGVTEEVPVGGAVGVVTMRENGKKLPNAMVTLFPVDRSDSAPKPRFATTDENGRYRIRNVQAGLYTLEVSGKAHRIDVKAPIDIKEGEPTLLDVNAEPVEPYLDLYANQHVFSPGEQAEVQLKGFTDSPDVQLSAYRLRFDEVIKEGSLYNALAPLARRDGKAKDPRTMGSIFREAKHSVANRDAEGTFIDTIKFDALEAGLYWVQMTSGKVTGGTWFSVSDIALVAKATESRAVCFVTNIQTGQPVAGASVGEVINGVFKPTATTDDRGLATISAKGDGSTAVLMARKDASQAFVDYYAGENNSKSKFYAYAYTDRPVYRPGDTIEFKGIARRLNGSRYAIPEGQTATVEFLDFDDTPLHTVQAPLSALGSYWGSVPTSKEIAPGYYSLKTTIGDDEFRSDVVISAYRKPAYTITVTPERDSYIRGERAKFTVKAEYYYGGPVVGASVELYISRTPSWDNRLYSDEETEWFEESGEGYDYGGDTFEELKGRTNDQGVVTFTVETLSPTDQSDVDWRYQIQASVVDDAGKYYDGSGSFKVVRGEFAMAAETNAYVIEPGQSFTLSIKTASNAARSTGGTQVALAAGYEVWNNNRSTFEPTTRQTVTLDPDGRGTAQFTPPAPGSYKVEAVASDARGNLIRSEAYIYVASRSGGGLPFDAAGIGVKLDKRKYAIGDTAKVLVSTDRPGGLALLTIEGEDLHHVQTVAMTGPSVTVDLGVRAEYLPNVYVSACYVSQKKFSEVSQMLSVDMGSKKMAVTVTPDRPQYEPGQTVTLRVESKDTRGMPAPAELSVGVVDESIYAIAKDRTDLYSQFYPRRYNAVRTMFSFPDLYLDGGDKAPTSVNVRRLFKDTAYWNPKVLTDSNGQATVSFKLPDNLTEWRATVWGQNAATEFGTAVVKFKSRKPLMVRLEAPTSAVFGDKVEVRALVTNATGANANVKVQFGTQTQNLSLEDGEMGSLKFEVAPEKTGTNFYEAKAWIEGGASDGVELTLPVLPHGRTYWERTTGELKGNGEFGLTLRDGADPNTGVAVLTITPSLGAVFTQSLDRLIGFPYGCVEQTMSRFVPAVVASGLMKQAGMPPVRKADELSAMVKDGYARLARMQHADGGWGWWVYDETNDFMTALVLEGLAQAQASGNPWESGRVRRALDWAAKRVEAPLPAKTEPGYSDATRNRLYLGYALALHGRNEAAAKALQRDPATLDAYSAATFALGRAALYGVGDFGVQNALARLRALAKVNSGTAKWEEAYWGVETSARALLALQTLAPSDPLTSKAIRGLILDRRGDIWYSTRDTTYALYALAERFRQQPDFPKGGSVSVSLNGTNLKTIDMAAGSAQAGRIEIPITDLNPGRNVFAVSRSDGGTVFYAAEMRQVVVQESVGKLINADGVEIERSFHVMRTSRQESGTIAFLPDPKPTQNFKPGDLVRVVLKIKSPQPRSYVMVESPTPAGFVVTERSDLGEGEEWSYWWADMTIRDDRVAFFMTNLPSGEQTLTYHLRVETPGSVEALPATIAPMYDPSSLSSSPELRLEVR